MNFFSRISKNKSIGFAAALLSGSYFLSAVLGLLRDRLLAANFGLNSGVLDAYWAAFSIPDLLYYFLVTGALSVTFIPVFVERMQNNNKTSAWELSSSVINLMAIVTFVGSILVFVFAGLLMHAIAPGFNQERHDLATALMRIVAINPFIFSISTVLGAMQQASGRFFFFAISPIIYNFGIILGIIFFTPHLGIIGAALGVALGSLLQLMVHVVGMIVLGFEYKPKIFWQNKGFKQVLRLILPRSLDQGIDAINSMVERFIASFLGFGAITSYAYAYNLQAQPIVLIGVAIATASFPSITKRAASSRIDLFRKEIRDVLGSILWFALPASVIAFLVRGYLVRLYLGQGSEVIAAALGWFTGAIIFRALFHALTRAYYAQQDTKTPLYISFFAIGLNIALAFLFVDRFDNSISGLAFAQSVVAAIESIILLLILHFRLGGIITRKLIYAGFKIMFATFIMAVPTYGMVRFVFPLQVADVGFFTMAPKFIAILLVSGISYIIASSIAGLNEAKLFISTAKRWFFKPLNLSDFR